MHRAILVQERLLDYAKFVSSEKPLQLNSILPLKSLENLTTSIRMMLDYIRLD